MIKTTESAAFASLLIGFSSLVGCGTLAPSPVEIDLSGQDLGELIAAPTDGIPSLHFRIRSDRPLEFEDILVGLNGRQVLFVSEVEPSVFDVEIFAPLDPGRHFIEVWQLSEDSLVARAFFRSATGIPLDPDGGVPQPGGLPEIEVEAEGPITSTEPADLGLQEPGQCILITGSSPVSAADFVVTLDGEILAHVQDRDDLRVAIPDGIHPGTHLIEVFDSSQETVLGSATFLVLPGYYLKNDISEE